MDKVKENAYSKHTNHRYLITPIANHEISERKARARSYSSCTGEGKVLNFMQNGSY